MGYDNVLVMSNSLCYVPVYEHWWGNWGMAASVRANDWVHKLQTRIRLVNPDCVVEPLNIADWERDHTTYDLTNFDSYFTTNRDLVIISIGANVDDETDFDVSLQALIDYIGTKTTARIAITGGFFVDASKDATIAAIALANDLPYTELSSLNIAANKSSIGATVYDEEGNPHAVDDAGVAAHPNDTGMNLIANKIYDILV